MLCWSETGRDGLDWIHTNPAILLRRIHCQTGTAEQPSVLRTAQRLIRQLVSPS